MQKKILAMLLAGGQGSRLGILTSNIAKPAVAFGGKYKIIDFAMSNCINSGIDTVGVLTQYQPLSLNRHIGIGIPWDLDKKNGGVTVLAPHVKGGESGEWYSGTANAIYQNIDYINSYNPEYVLILSGDHIYKMDYSIMLDDHIKKGSHATIAVLEVTIEEASRFGIMNTNPDGSIYEFEEKPKEPKSNLASMGIYIFNWSNLKEALIRDSKIHLDSDFGKHIIPAMLEEGLKLNAFKFDSYWKDVGTIESYWAANMELIKTLPDFNLYEDFWQIYTNSEHQPPVYTSHTSDIKTSLLSEGCEVYGKVYNSVLGPDVFVDEGAFVKDSIIMQGCVIGKGTHINRAIVDEYAKIGGNTVIGQGENLPNEDYPSYYDTGITVIGAISVVPDDVVIGKNCVILGTTSIGNYPNGILQSGKSIMIQEAVL
ncbi:MAG: glucose-1-phosphate adenylyltransferase [Clostridiales bacterium]|jgi:glucose-1-phosphate adenylyltransferase|nr:glucose-1-phosphate adenylyltransferase [Clostridiales bacterium]